MHAYKKYQSYLKSAISVPMCSLIFRNHNSYMGTGHLNIFEFRKP